MDKQILALMIPVLLFSIPVIAIIFNGMHKLARLRIEEARIRSNTSPSQASEDVDLLRGEVDQLRRDLSEVQERLDFAERLLARESDRPRLAHPPR